MLVKDLMVGNVVTISPFATLRETITLMNEKRVKALAVDKSHPHDAYGFLTYTSLLKAIVAEEGDMDLINVYDVYMKPAITISKEMDIKYAAKMMINMRFKRLLVVDGEKLEGIISMTDIVNSLIASE